MNKVFEMKRYCDKNMYDAAIENDFNNGLQAILEHELINNFHDYRLSIETIDDYEAFEAAFSDFIKSEYGCKLVRIDWCEYRTPFAKRYAEPVALTFRRLI